MRCRGLSGRYGQCRVGTCTSTVVYGYGTAAGTGVRTQLKQPHDGRSRIGARLYPRQIPDDHHSVRQSFEVRVHQLCIVRLFVSYYRRVKAHEIPSRPTPVVPSRQKCTWVTEENANVLRVRCVVRRIDQPVRMGRNWMTTTQRGCVVGTGFGRPRMGH